MQQTTPSADPEILRSLSRGVAASCAGFNLRRASRAVTQHFDRALAPVGLRTTQFTLLAALALAGPVGINRLSQGLVLDRTTLTRNLRLLRDAGLVETQPGRAGRGVLYHLTDAGREALARALPIWGEAQGGIVGAFGEEQWPGMVAELRRLVDGTVALDPAGPRVRPHPAAGTSADTQTPPNGHPTD